MIVQLCNSKYRDIYIDTYCKARRFMSESGNPHQWENKDFAASVDADLNNGCLYEIRNDDNMLLGVFAMLPSPDHTYDVIDGKWLTNGDYYVVHRVASTFVEGRFLDKVIAYVEQHSSVIRIDTHKDNLPMQKAILRCGFSYCGIIHLADGSPRMAYERVVNLK